MIHASISATSASIKLIRWITLPVAFALSSCAFHHTPYPMYEGNPPLATTAVFVAVDDKATKRVVSSITRVDAKKTSCVQVGCPLWVRTLPGSHTFTINYQVNFSTQVVGSGVSIVSNAADLKVEVPDMKASHVYIARYREVDGKILVQVDDLGERPAYGLNFGPNGYSTIYYPVSFD